MPLQLGGKTRKILFLGPSLGVGGEERVVFDLATHLDRARFAPTIACCYGAGTIGERLEQSGLPVYHSLFRNRSDPRGVRRLIDLCRRERFDLLHVNEQPLAMFWGAIAARLCGIRATVMAVHTTGERGRRQRCWLNRLLPFDAVVALTEGHKQELCAAEHLPAARVHVIHNGIDPTPYLRASKASSPLAAVPHGVPLVGIVAMLRPEKAHDVFLRAAAAVSSSSPAHFLIVGDGPERARLEQMALACGLGPRLHFLGRRDDIPQVMAALDVVVLSSLTEALPIVVLEAMACGKPVVCSKVGLIPEVVADLETGILVPPADAAQLANGILFLLHNPDRARGMGQMGRKRLLQSFTLNRMVRRMEDLFRQLLPGVRP